MIAVIGATGSLGKALMKYPGTVACPIRFEQADKYYEWFELNKDIDTIWHVARACKKEGVRRDFDTFMLEQRAMQKLLTTRARDCRFIFASTKVVYGITTEEVTPLSADTIATDFLDDVKGTINCPIWKRIKDIDIKQLGTEHLIYALTKLVCERYIREHCQNHKIIRIWDIHQVNTNGVKKPIGEPNYVQV